MYVNVITLFFPNTCFFLTLTCVLRVLNILHALLVNWSGLYRIFVLLQVSILSALGSYNVGIINPAYNELSAEFGISTVTASYQTLVQLISFSHDSYTFSTEPLSSHSTALVLSYLSPLRILLAADKYI